MAQKFIAAVTSLALALGTPANSTDSDDIAKAILGLAAIGLIAKKIDDNRRGPSSETQTTRSEHIHRSEAKSKTITHRHRHHHLNRSQHEHEHVHELPVSVIRGGQTVSQWHQTAHAKPKPEPKPKVINHSHRHKHNGLGIGHAHGTKHKHSHSHELPGWLRLTSDKFKSWHRNAHQSSSNRLKSKDWRQTQGWAKHNH